MTKNKYPTDRELVKIAVPIFIEKKMKEIAWGIVIMVVAKLLCDIIRWTHIKYTWDEIFGTLLLAIGIVIVGMFWIKWNWECSKDEAYEIWKQKN